MSSPIKNVIVIGAGGHLGTYLLPTLQSDGRFNVSVLARNSSKSTFPSSVKVYNINDDYPDNDLVKAFTGQDAVICVISGFAIKEQNRFIDAAVKASVKRFVPSEFGSDTSNDKIEATVPSVMGPKLASERYLKEKERDGLTWTAIVTGPFFEMAVRDGFLGYDIKGRKATVFDKGDFPTSQTTMGTIALAIKNTLLLPKETANKKLYIASFSESANTIIATLEKVSGDKFQVTHVDGEEQKKIGNEKLAKGDFSGLMELIRYINLVEGYGGNYVHRELANDLLSLPKEDLEETLAKYV